MAPTHRDPHTQPACAGSVVPAPPVLAIVRHADIPSTPPSALADHLELKMFGGRPDWTLSAAARTLPEVSSQFVEWRGSWERTWRLEPTTSISALCTIAESIAAKQQLRGTDMIDVLAESALRDTIVTPQYLSRAHTFVVSLRQRLAQLPGKGFGFVDATPGIKSSGLARTWSPTDGMEILAADSSMVVAMHPDLGLTVCVSPTSGLTMNNPDELLDAGDVTAGIEQVSIDDDSIRLHGRYGTQELASADGQPMTWILPGSTLWRVRRIPLSVVWARTLAGLEDASTYATTLNAPIGLVSEHVAGPLSADNQPS